MSKDVEMKSEDEDVGIVRRGRRALKEESPVKSKDKKNSDSASRL